MIRYSQWDWLILLIVWIVWIVPLYRILGRVGFNRGWAFLAFPPLGMIMLWVVAFVRWPVAGASERQAADLPADAGSRR